MAGNVGAHPMEFCKWWTFIASAAIFVGAATWHVACTVILLARTTHLSKKELDRLGPTASARELLALRRDVFERATRKKRG